MSDLEKSIFYTIAWFDIFDYPLTSWEIYRWGYQMSVVNYQLLVTKLQKSEELKKMISHKHGFYFLKWRDDLVKIRKERYLLAEKKYQKLGRMMNILKIAPFVKVVAVATGLSYFNSKENDDIDLLVMTDKSKLWTARFFLVLFLKILRARPTLRDKKDKICLNFFIDESKADLKSAMLLERNSWPDMYFIYWLAWLYPVFQINETWKEFLKKNNWLKKFLPHYLNPQPASRRSIKLGLMARLTKKVIEKVFSFKIWEKSLHWLQMQIMPRKLRELANKNSSVIINDSMLKLHDKDKREEYRNKFYEKIGQID